MNYNRGSEWRKWDLHIHTPGTAKNDNFGNSEEIWDQYIDALEKTDVAVFGITDYFSIRNYLKVKEYQQHGRLQGKFLLPNVELRMLPTTKKGISINIHVIFDPNIDVSDLEREFFRPLQFPYQNAKYSCIDTDLARLGRIVEGNPILPTEAAIKKGIETFTVSYGDLHDVVSKEYFKGRIIIALSNSNKDGVSGILEHEGDLSPLRNEISRMADVILSGNPSDVEYFLGEKTSIEEVIESKGGLKPCIFGSDAHSLEEVGVFKNDRITWIKADPTFEGLKQILFEPKERVRISASMPDPKYDYNVIERVVLNSANVWSQEIPFNQNLNTIIGGRSTGKSTLLACIASKISDKINTDNKDFINQLSENVHVFWRDGQESNAKEIEYFTQNEIANLIDKDDSDKLFCDILIGDPSKREAFEKFKSDEAVKFSSIQSKVALYFEKVRQYSAKFSYVKSLGDKEGINREIDKLDKQRIAIQQKLTGKQEILNSYQTIEKDLALLRHQSQIQLAELEAFRRLNELDLLVQNKSLPFFGLTSENVTLLSDEIKRVLLQANVQIKDFLKGQLEKAEESNKVLTRQIFDKENNVSYKEGKQILQENQNLVYLTKQISILTSKRDLIDKETTLLNQIVKEHNDIYNDLINEHLSYLELMNSIASILRIQHDNITLSASFELKPELEKTLGESFSLRSLAMSQLISETISQYKKKTKEDIRKSATDLLNKALRGEIIFKNGHNAQTFISNTLSTNWFKLKFNVVYENDNLLDMSPGKRSFVVLKLLLDFSNKKCPILIDQPEDNLDNSAIYNELVKYIREKKKERQIILVTHNPNIVVGADSEEVIVANQNGKNAPNDGGIKFQYVSGSLENTATRFDDVNMPILKRGGIREHVCDILEGGENAFRDRENKYGFFKI